MDILERMIQASLDSSGGLDSDKALLDEGAAALTAARAENLRLRAATQALTKAIKDVQNYISDPTSYIHSVLETPLFIHEGTIDDVRRKS